jgi:hypothetical protein
MIAIGQETMNGRNFRETHQPVDFLPAKIFYLKSYSASMSGAIFSIYYEETNPGWRTGAVDMIDLSCF